MELPYAESYKIKMVEPMRRSNREEREFWIKQATYNLFQLKGEHVFIDLLSDSGTGAMSDRQWSQMMLGDESYAGSRSYYHLKDAVKDILGFDYFLPTHQGRAAENVLFSALVKEGDVVPGNSHFDTTKGHIEYRRAKAIDCTINEAFDMHSEHPFKGNISPEKLKKVLKTHSRDKIPFITFTVTNNNVGGQPVSIANIKEISDIARQHRIPVLIDSARFAENAYFIKLREKGYADKSIKEIVKEMYEQADLVTMSGKKGAIVNIGGFMAFKDEKVYKEACNFNILLEGFITYGGMAGRDMDALAQGLYEGTEFEFLKTRIKQVEYLGRRLMKFGIPIQKPIGGHAVYIDAKKMLPNIPKKEFAAQTLAIELYKEAGVRGCEIGTLLADRDPITRLNRYPKLEFLRLAIPRRTYTNNHMDVVAVALKNIFDRRNKIVSGYKIIHEAAMLRHFTVELEKV